MGTRGLPEVSMLHCEMRYCEMHPLSPASDRQVCLFATGSFYFPESGSLNIGPINSQFIVVPLLMDMQHQLVLGILFFYMTEKAEPMSV